MVFEYFCYKIYYSFRLQLRLLNKRTDRLVKTFSKAWQDLKWNDSLKRSYQTVLLTLKQRILPFYPELRAAIYYHHHTKTKQSYLIGFSKCRYQNGLKTKLIIAHYTANLYHYKNMLCYHYVEASNIYAAKKSIKQKDHMCKISYNADQPTCKNGGMSYGMIVRYSSYFRNLLNTPSQNILIRSQKKNNRH